MRKLNKLAAAAAVGLFFACSASVGPVEIESGDMCSFCRMAISDKRFAAEIVNADESVLKFDDIGCMLRYRSSHVSAVEPAAVYVADSRSRNWLKAENAHFIRSATIKTPMGSGIVAFASAESAGEGAVSFSELSK